MRHAQFRLILLICCAHALVHVYELSLPSVEQQIAEEYYEGDAVRGKLLTGQMSNSWRVTWGFGALAAGWLVDRYGSRLMLAVYLLGCGALCIAVGWCQTTGALFVVMVVMGALASIYHPAGLALISQTASADDRSRALGMHGVFGSLGIGFAPFAAALILDAGMGWRVVYWWISVPGVLLGLVFVWVAWRQRSAPTAAVVAASLPPSEPRWRSFLTLTVVAMLQGFVYAAVFSFLPRYLSEAPAIYDVQEISDRNQVAQTDDLVQGEMQPRTSTGMWWAMPVLLSGCMGQFLAGRWARTAWLEKQLVAVILLTIPFLLWMSAANGMIRVWAAAGFALVHFMHQPIYNSLIAQYTPPERRSICYGFSFASGLGLGSVGALFAGVSRSDFVTYLTLAAVAGFAAMVGLVLVRQNRHYDSPFLTESNDRPFGESV